MVLAALLVLILGLVLLATFGFWLWMLIDVLTKQKEDKLVWVLVVLFLHCLGALFYYFLVRKKRETNAVVVAA